MIQRSQTLWLLLSLITSGLSFQFPFAVGETSTAEASAQLILDGGSSLFILILTIFIQAIALFTIFLFKNRKNQQWLCTLGIIASSLLLFLYIMEMKKMIQPVPALTSLFVLAVIGGFIMALVGIRRDEKLINNQDKLR
jgi:hypothetical protein